MHTKMPVVGDDQEFIRPEAKPSGEAGICFQEAAASKHELQNRDKAVMDCPAGGLLAVVEKTHPPVTHIDAEISLMSHQQNTRSMVHVAVVMDVDQKVVLHNLFLDPGMKDRNKVRYLEPYRLGYEDLDPKSLHVH